MDRHSVYEVAQGMQMGSCGQPETKDKVASSKVKRCGQPETKDKVASSKVKRCGQPETKDKVASSEVKRCLLGLSAFSL